MGVLVIKALSFEVDIGAPDLRNRTDAKISRGLVGEV